MASLPRAFLGTLALTAFLSAQRTWIVDQAQRAPFDFSDLPQALVAASDGDVLILRSTLGHPYYPLEGYTTATTNKGVTIIGEPGARFAPNNVAALTVAGLPAGRSFVLAGMTFPLPSGAGGIFLNGCVGPVHVERVTVSGGSAPMRIAGCRLVTVCNSSLVGASPVQIDPSTSAGIALVDCSASSTSGAAVVVGGSQTAGISLMVAGGTLSGRSAISYSANQRPGSASLTVAGGRATTVATIDSSPVIYWDGPLTIDPTVQIIGTIQSYQQPVMQRSPALTALGAPPSQPIRTSIRSSSGDVAVLLLSVPMARTPTPPFGDLWIDPSLIFFATGGVQGAGEQLDFTIPTPASAPRGLLLGLQALAGPGIDVRLSNPSVVVIN